MKIWSKTIAIALVAFTLSSVGLSSSSAEHHQLDGHQHSTALQNPAELQAELHNVVAPSHPTSTINNEALISTVEQCALACIFCILTFAAIRRFNSKLISQKIAQGKIAFKDHRNISDLLTNNFKPSKGLILRM